MCRTVEKFMEVSNAQFPHSIRGAFRRMRRTEDFIPGYIPSSLREVWAKSFGIRTRPSVPAVLPHPGPLPPGEGAGLGAS